MRRPAGDDTAGAAETDLEGMTDGVAKDKLEEMIDEIDAEERLRRLNENTD